MQCQQCFFLQLFNHYSALKNRWGLYRLESKQKNKCEMGRQPHCEPQTCTPGVNYTLMESCMRACIHKRSHHFRCKCMHMHNKWHEGMQPYVLLGKCKLAHMWSVCGDQPVTSISISAALHLGCEASSARLQRISPASSSTFTGRLLTKLSIECFNLFFIFLHSAPLVCLSFVRETIKATRGETKYIE